MWAVGLITALLAGVVVALGDVIVPPGLTWPELEDLAGMGCGSVVPGAAEEPGLGCGRTGGLVLGLG